MARRAALTDIEVLTADCSSYTVVRDASVEVTWYMISRPGVA